MNKKSDTSPKEGSFFILTDKEGKGYIYYSDEGKGLDHMKLWQVIVNNVFTKLDWDNRRDLESSFYAADRGRIVWQGDYDQRDNPIKDTGKYALYGTPGCAKYKGKIMNIFKLNDLNKNELSIDWVTDPHYKVLPSDKDALETMVKLLGNKLTLHDKRIASKESNKIIFIQKVFAKLAA